MQVQIRKKKEEPQQLKGKRLRGDAGNPVTQNPEVQCFWY